MNKEQTRAAAAVMLAWAEGKEVECKLRVDDEDEWDAEAFPGWDWVYYEYRIKAEPREFFVEVLSCGTPKCAYRSDPSIFHPTGNFIRVREVLE